MIENQTQRIINTLAQTKRAEGQTDEQYAQVILDTYPDDLATLAQLLSGAESKRSFSLILEDLQNYQLRLLSSLFISQFGSRFSEQTLAMLADALDFEMATRWFI
ncbi:MAG TPA: hypothetical protein VLH19_05475 [Patescibacteria group bacterium]|nr:hypothetical protein [Patescibacteria group bacterium]